MNFTFEEYNDGYTIYAGGIQINQRNKFEKALLESKKIAQKAVEENVELIAIRNTLLETQHQLELQLRKLSRKESFQRELSKVLSHDLQEPLRKINLFSSRLLENEDLNHETDLGRGLLKISRFVEQVRHLLEKLEQYNGLEGKALEHVPVNIEEAVLKAKMDCGLSSEKVNIVFENHLEPDKKFLSDNRLVLILFRELLVHAFSYHKNDDYTSKIKISVDTITENVFTELKDAYKYEECLRIVFEDNSNQKYIPSTSIFDLFWKLDAEDTELRFGLAYCKRIVQLLDGNITTATNKKQSLKFIITLPFK
ncbi:sensor histidine kinase [Flavobacterium agrisoli]|uniref:histidine kinase n=1 Tax=Flavobacterium agrisoli TaxID=2793066 RepID=A0A934UI96_9FLAO|nr:HAMP domain-containing histidine kinase [Flavobacterium agrisoli]MBK0368384.1 HAMP domain-containing histidine kinase [Flavobacterium agrisoli]